MLQQGKNGIVKYCESCGEQGQRLCLEVIEGMQLFFLSSCFAGLRELGSESAFG